METPDMVRMANQIGNFFKGYGDDYAMQEIAVHINAFWDPRMRKMLIAHLENGGEGLDTVVKAAAVNIKRPKEVA